MKRYIFMLVTCLVASGSLTAILLWFLKRVRKIEDDFWGKQKEAATHKRGGKT